MKGAFLINFARFVEWPATSFPSPDSPLVIGILGENPFGGSLEAMVRGRSAGHRPLAVKFIGTPEEAAHCHLVFVAGSERRLAGRLVAQPPSAVLTVGEVEGFAERGGVIQFTIENNRVRFLVNPDAARRANLQVSAKLLSVATVVRDHRGGER